MGMERSPAPQVPARLRSCYASPDAPNPSLRSDWDSNTSARDVYTKQFEYEWKQTHVWPSLLGCNQLLNLGPLGPCCSPVRRLGLVARLKGRQLSPPPTRFPKEVDVGRGWYAAIEQVGWDFYSFMIIEMDQFSKVCFFCQYKSLSFGWDDLKQHVLFFGGLCNRKSPMAWKMDILGWNVYNMCIKISTVNPETVKNLQVRISRLVNGELFESRGPGFCRRLRPRCPSMTTSQWNW